MGRVSPSRCLCSSALFLIGFLSLAAAQNPLAGLQPEGCASFRSLDPPAVDLPTKAEIEALGSCNSADLYFGFGKPADPVEARKCAYVERLNGKNVPDTVFGAAGLLTMIYANGKGATRNFDLALKFACETGWAPAEMVERFDHLIRLKSENWTGDNFSLCDDATSGFMEGWCVSLQDHFDQVKRDQKLAALTSSWNSQERQALSKLQKSAEAFFETSSHYEIDLSGTIAGAYVVEAQACYKDGFISALESFESGTLPNFSQADFRRVNVQLNSRYSAHLSEVAKSVKTGEMGTVKPNGIRRAERLWLQYREAWVEFGAIKYPAIPANGWRTWLTQQRLEMVQDPFSKCFDKYYPD